MGLLARTRSFWRNALHRSDMERRMSDELQFHLAARANDLVERRGVSSEEAMRIARLEFGSVEKYKEEARQSLGLKLGDETGGDLRYARKCAVCALPLPERNAVLDRLKAMAGYMEANTRLICRDCDYKVQESRGFA